MSAEGRGLRGGSEPTNCTTRPGYRTKPLKPTWLRYSDSIQAVPRCMRTSSNNHSDSGSLLGAPRHSRCKGAMASALHSSHESPGTSDINLMHSGPL